LQRQIGKRLWPLFKFLATILNLSRDYWIVDLRSNNPKVSNLKKLGKYDYISVQKFGTERKISRIKQNRKELHLGKPTKKVELLASLLKREFPDRTISGICHGVRSGVENNWLLSQLPRGSKIIGTDIHSDITGIPNCIKWDFHEIKREWENNFDFVYCNSLDQSNRPLIAIYSWLKSLKIDSGILFLDIGRHTGKNGNTLLDPFCIEPELAPFFLLKHFKGCTLDGVHFPFPGDFRTTILELKRGSDLELINVELPVD